jgi:2-phosphosulfolactate phosphatase
VEIHLESLLEGAHRAIGAVAVIDVFRAFTTGAVALANGAEKIVMVSSIRQALELRAAGVGQVCVGEANSIKPPEFDHGNSPSEIEYVEFNGKTLIQRTSAGTQGIVACRNADRLYATALVTAPATARALAAGNPEIVSLVAMGEDGTERTDEDEMCAVHIRHLLEGRHGDPDAIRRVIQAGDEAPARFLDPNRPDSPVADLAICLDIGRYDFAIRVRQEDGLLVARKEIPGQG